MSLIDPRLRQRASATPTRPTARKNLTNTELLALFEETTRGNIKHTTLRNYVGTIRDAIAYFRTDAGVEIPAREWEKDGVWRYLLHVENNYCGAFRVVSFLKPVRVMCEQNTFGGPSHHPLKPD